MGAPRSSKRTTPQWRYTIAALTRRIPEPIPFTINAYFSFRAILLAVENFNKRLGEREIDSISRNFSLREPLPLSPESRGSSAVVLG